MTRLLYITSPGHSGSTLLCMLLGRGEGWLATGELRRLPWQLARRADEGDSVEAQTLCTCGASLPDCPVWGKALPAEAFEDPYGRYNLSFLEPQAWLPAGQRDRPPRLRGVYRRLTESPLHRLAGLVRPFTAGTIAGRNWELIDRAAKVSGSAVVVDATKSLIRFDLLNRRRPVDLVVLLRDIADVASSAVGYGRDPVVTAHNWLSFYERTARYLEATGVRPVLVRYDDVCADPEGVVERIARAFDLPAPGAPVSAMHLVAGNPSRYRPLVVRRDNRRTKNLDPKMAALIEELRPRSDALVQRLERLSRPG